MTADGGPVTDYNNQLSVCKLSPKYHSTLGQQCHRGKVTARA